MIFSFLFSSFPTVAASLLMVLVGAFGVVRKKTLPNAVFCVVALLLAGTGMMDLELVRTPEQFFTIIRLKLFLESLLPASFLLFSLTYARTRPLKLKKLSIRWGVLLGLSALFPLGLLVFPIHDFFPVSDLFRGRHLLLGPAGYWFYLGIMVYCILAVVNLETVFSATASADRWRIKFEYIGVTAILAVLIFYFSQGLLYRMINIDLAPLRSWVFLVSSLLIGYSRVWRGDAQVSVSRYITYRSFALLVIGVYLLALGLAGEGMKYIGLPFGRDTILFIIFFSGIFVTALMLSEEFRRKIRLFVDKNFYATKYDYRAEWLQFSKRLASCSSTGDVLNAVLTAYRESFGLRGALLFLSAEDKDALSLAAAQEMDCPVKTVRLSRELRDYFIVKNRVLNPSGPESAPFREEASFACFAAAGARAAVPLVANGAVHGLLLFGEQITREEFAYEDYDLMKTLARQATPAIINFRLSEELAEARELAAVSKISAFVIHDLKNHAQTLSLLLENAGAHMEDPDFQKDMLSTIGNTVGKMNSLIQRLKTVPERGMLDRRPVDVRLLADEAVRDFTFTKAKNKNANLTVLGPSSASNIDAEEIKKVIVNLLLNAFEASRAGGPITVETGVRNGMCFIEVSDEGCGISGDFIQNHMFRPFRTTKPKGLGIGLYQCMQIVKAHEGSIEVRSEPGKGTAFTVLLPIAK